MMVESRRKIAIASVALLAVMMVSAFVVLSPSTAEGFEGPEDAMGNTIFFDTAPEKIISTAPSISELLYALDSGDEIVAISSNCDYPADLVTRAASGDLKKVGSYNSPNVERITDADADVIFVSYTAGGVGAYNLLRTIGEPVVMLHQEETVADVYKNIELMSEILQKKSVGDNLVKGMKADFTQIVLKSAVQDFPYDYANWEPTNPNVLMHLGWYGQPIGAPWLYGADTFGSDIVSLVNATNHASYSSGFFNANMEFVENGIIDVIIATGLGAFDDHADAMQVLEAHPIWSETNAVKNGEVYFLVDRAADITQRAGPGLVDLGKIMTMIIHPNQFEGFEPNDHKVIGDDYADMFEGYW